MNELLDKGAEVFKLFLTASLRDPTKFSYVWENMCEERKLFFKMSKICLGNDFKMLRQFENHEKL